MTDQPGECTALEHDLPRTGVCSSCGQETRDFLDVPAADAVAEAARDAVLELGPCQYDRSWCLTHHVDEPCPVGLLRVALEKAGWPRLVKDATGGEQP